jgi:hypothetical protein
MVQFKFDVRVVCDHRDGIERPSTQASKPTEHHASAFGLMRETRAVTREHFNGTVRWRLAINGPAHSLRNHMRRVRLPSGRTSAAVRRHAPQPAAPP